MIYFVIFHILWQQKDLKRIMNLIFIGILFGIIELTISLRLNNISLRRNFKLASKPSRIENTANYIESKLKSIELKSLRENNTRKRVAIIGGGLSGLSCAKYLIDAGHIPICNSFIWIQNPNYLNILNTEK